MDFHLDWLIQRCLQVYLSDFNQSALQLRLEQTSSRKQLIQIHTEMISKKIFGDNWTMFTENDFHIDLQHSSQTKIFDYQNYIENEDQGIFIDYLQQVNTLHSSFLLSFSPYSSIRIPWLFWRNILNPSREKMMIYSKHLNNFSMEFFFQ